MPARIQLLLTRFSDRYASLVIVRPVQQSPESVDASRSYVMRMPALTLLMSVHLAGCSVTSIRTSAGPVPLEYGSASSFIPLVAATSAPSSCVAPEDAPLEPGAEALALYYPGPPQRQVTVTLNSAGEPTRYVDVRGDLAQPGSSAHDRTTIGLYLEQGYAVLSNRQATEVPTMLEVPWKGSSHPRIRGI